MGEWTQLAPGLWRRAVPGGWLDVRQDGPSRWRWVHMVDGYQFASAQCLGLFSRQEAQESADRNFREVKAAKPRRRPARI